MGSFFERGVSQATQNSEAAEGLEAELPMDPPKRRRWSDILHARRRKNFEASILKCDLDISDDFEGQISHGIL